MLRRKAVFHALEQIYERVFCSINDFILLQLSIKRAPIYTEGGCSFDLMTGVSLKHQDDISTLDLRKWEIGKHALLELIVLSQTTLEHIRGEIINADFIFDTDSQGVFNYVFEFAHVSGPGITKQSVYRVFSAAPLGNAPAFRMTLQEVIDKEHDVVAALPQLRHVQWHHSQAEEKVGSKPLFANCGVEIAVGR
jgi:hypothetical protein